MNNLNKSAPPYLLHHIQSESEKSWKLWGFYRWKSFECRPKRFYLYLHNINLMNSLCGHFFVYKVENVMTQILILVYRNIDADMVIKLLSQCLFCSQFVIGWKFRYAGL